LSFHASMRLPGDKSISHRAALLSALSNRTTLLNNYPLNNDCLFTLRVLRQLGIKVAIKRLEGFRADVRIAGKGLHGFRPPRSSLYVGESGTTLRLILGILAGQEFKTKLIAGKSLSTRPMLRVTGPLRMMGAQLDSVRVKRGLRTEEYPPISIKGGKLKPIVYTLPIASAQVKSAILLAGLFAAGKTSVDEPVKTRDHTERMLELFRADIRHTGKKVVINGGGMLVSPGRIYIPGDISSASFFMVLAALIPCAEVAIENTSVNPSRLGIVKVLKRMGADIRVIMRTTHSFEPMGTILVRNKRLKGVRVSKEAIPSLIDELPILMVAASFARGKSVFEGIEELKVKETDRIISMCENLKKMGAGVEVFRKAGHVAIRIAGGKLRGASVRSFGDHRTAMSMIIAGLAAEGMTELDDVSCIDKSFPGFTRLIRAFSVKS
ncbi:MAG: 3-phosphoshikimate 1-carboxyvinyltransferase, partial [Candidatus Omnitrophica bacterium]|nr:3-phosphoshikimate 1-carboxyvinyltransferase [Candidatus Omnitrophota bacterium]